MEYNEFTIKSLQKIMEHSGNNTLKINLGVGLTYTNYWYGWDQWYLQNGHLQTQPAIFVTDENALWTLFA